MPDLQDFRTTNILLVLKLSIPSVVLYTRHTPHANRKVKSCVFLTSHVSDPKLIYCPVSFPVS